MVNFFSGTLPLLLICCALFCIFLLWKKRWYFYYGFKLPGPFTLPLIGNPLRMYYLGHPDTKNSPVHEKFPPIFRLWLGPILYVVISEPKYLQIILPNFLDKGKSYNDAWKDVLGRSVISTRVDDWKNKRKLANHSFSTSVLHNSVDIFAKHANALVEKLNSHAGGDFFDVLSLVSGTIMDNVVEALGAVDPQSLDGQDDFINGWNKTHEVLYRHFRLFWADIFWKLSPARRTMMRAWKQSETFVKKVIDLNMLSKYDSNEDHVTKRRFLNNFLTTREKHGFSLPYVIEETSFFFLAAFDTTSVALSTALVLLGMYPHIQQKVSDELDAIDEDLTIECLNRMEYLERVIKETLRIATPVPGTIRTLHQDLQIDSYVIPNGAIIVVPIAYMHRNSDLWPNPLEFDPDRFLPENSAKRHPCAFIPFSYGPRNCIGFRYAMLSLKVTLSIVLRNYKVVATQYRKIEDIDIFSHFIAKAAKGYKIKLERKK